MGFGEVGSQGLMGSIGIKGLRVSWVLGKQGRRVLWALGIEGLRVFHGFWGSRVAGICGF